MVQKLVQRFARQRFLWCKNLCKGLQLYDQLKNTCIYDVSVMHPMFQSELILDIENGHFSLEQLMVKWVVVVFYPAQHL
jgi:hypothetical protein